MPLTIVLGSDVTFTYTGSSDATSYLWEFGDGQTSTSQNPTNTYAAVGTYLVTLTVTSPSGTAVFNDTVTVTAATSVAYSTPTPAWTYSQGHDPQVMLRVSNDGGRNWVMEQWCSGGKQGEFTKRVKWNRLGSSRKRVFEVVVTDPVVWRLLAAYMAVEKGA